jgi:hypothetical protein
VTPPRCAACLVLEDGSSVGCVDFDHGGPAARIHVGYAEGVRRVTWTDRTQGAAVRVTLGRRRKLAELLEVSR